MLGKLNRKRIAFENSFFLFLRTISITVARWAFFIVFFWFGLLKMMELSPAGNVVHTLYEHTLWFIPWKLYIYSFGAYECIIGIIFLFPGKEKWALYMLVPHAITTFGPLIVMPSLTWKGLFIPNLIGQYIIKNLVIIALAIFIAVYEAERHEQKKQSSGNNKQEEIGATEKVRS